MERLDIHKQTGKAVAVSVKETFDARPAPIRVGHVLRLDELTGKNREGFRLTTGFKMLRAGGA